MATPNNEIKIGDEMFHPCNLDIIKHKITCIKQYDGFNHYELKATNPVGACGRIRVIVDEHKGKFRFVELIGEDELEYASGLRDFVEGDYYRTLTEARLVFYEQQRILSLSNVSKKENLLEEAKARHAQIERIIKEAKESTRSEQTK